MPTLNIHLFGKFCVQRNKQVLEGFDARKVQELFCYLLLHRDHSLPRETLAGILWPDTTTVQSKKSLRQALWQLQSALGGQSDSMSERVLLVEPEWIQLHLALSFRNYERQGFLVNYWTRNPGMTLPGYSIHFLQ